MIPKDEVLGEIVENGQANGPRELAQVDFLRLFMLSIGVKVLDAGTPGEGKHLVLLDLVSREVPLAIALLTSTGGTQPPG